MVYLVGNSNMIHELALKNLPVIYYGGLSSFADHPLDSFAKNIIPIFIPNIRLTNNMIHSSLKNVSHINIQARNLIEIGGTEAEINQNNAYRLIKGNPHEY